MIVQFCGFDCPDGRFHSGRAGRPPVQPPRAGRRPRFARGAFGFGWTKGVGGGGGGPPVQAAVPASACKWWSASPNWLSMRVSRLK